jgi:hypothetical protein
MKWKEHAVFLVTPYSLAVEPDLAQSRFDDARTVSRNIQFVKNKNNDFAR